MSKRRLTAWFFALLLIFPLQTAPAAALRDPTPQHCTAAAIMDGSSGEVLYSYHGSERRYPASLTKVMTALLVMEALSDGRLSLDQEITASAGAVKLPPYASTAKIKKGETLTVEQLLYCALLISANEACNILAEALEGSVPAFVDRMNEKAQALGMTDTHFVTANGLHDEEHYTTALDLLILARAAMAYETFRAIVGTASYTVPATNLSKERKLNSTNFLLSNPDDPDYAAHAAYAYSKATGIKTGFTTPAGRCLLSAAVSGDGRTYYCVVLGAENIKNEDGTLTQYAFIESRRLLEWAFYAFRPALGLPFLDVRENSPYTPGIRWAVERRITRGTSSSAFSPDKVCTHGQILTFLWRAAGYPTSRGVCPFREVTPESPYYTALCWANEQGLLSGEISRSGQPCTRSQTAAYLWKLAGRPDAGAPAFTDVPASASYAAAVAWAAKKGITNGTSGSTFSPDEPCTRGQIVTFLYRYLGGIARSAR